MPPSYIQIEIPNIHLPTLTTFHIDKLPAPFLNFLRQDDKVQNLSAFQVISFEEQGHDSIVEKLVDFYVARKLHLSELQVSDENGGTMFYNEVAHGQDTSLTTTPETHELLVEYCHLYFQCIRVGMDEFQADLSETICTRLPVYEAGIIVLLEALHKSPDSLKHADLGLLSYLSQRMIVFKDSLAQNEAVQSALRSVIPAKEILRHMLPSLDEASCNHILTECHIGERHKATARVDLFAQKHNADAARVSQREVLPQAQPGTQRQRSPSPGTGLRRYRSQVPQTPPTVPILSPAWRLDETTHDEDFGRRTSIPDLFTHDTVRSNTAPSQKRARSPRPDSNQTHAATDTEARRPFNEAEYRGEPIRPLTTGAFYSVAEDQWQHKHPHKNKRRVFHRVAIMCETTFGKRADNPCDYCKKRRYDCVVPTDPSRGLKCARCTFTHDSCSFKPAATTKKARSPEYD